MIHIRDHKTGYLFDPWDHLGPKRRKLMDESWAGLFREHILNELPVDKVASRFTEGFGRRTKELYTATGVVLLQQMHDLSDEEAVYQLAFSEQWHYALDIPDESDDAKYLCPKTLWSMRKIFTDNNLDDEVFARVADKLAQVFSVDAGKQRIDSVHIKSNMRHLGRIGIFTHGIHKFLVNLKRQRRELFDGLPQEMTDKYLSKKALACFSMVKPSASERTLESVAKDLFDLAPRFVDDPEVSSMTSFQLLLRILKEQCNITDADDGQLMEVAVKPAKEVASDSLQNPSDPDAAYDGRKGQGYQMQVMETYCDVEDEKVKAETLNLITHVAVEPACRSDAHALIPVLEATKQQGLAPEEVLADSLYGSDENCEAAKKDLGVEVVSPTMGAPQQNAGSINDFKISDAGEVVSCPRGHAPVKIKRNKHKTSVAFDSRHCHKCPLRDDCPARPGQGKGKRFHYLRYESKDIRLARRKAYEQTAEFIDRYRWRAGVEATMSEYNARTSVKRLRVRGFKAVKLCATLKAAAINIFRAAAVQKALNRKNGSPGGENSFMNHVVFVFKEQFSHIDLRLRNISRQFETNNHLRLNWAAYFLRGHQL